MSELLSMLVPLDTLPGWPIEPDPTWTHQLGLLIGIPAIVVCIIVLLAKGPSLAKASRKSPLALEETLWLGAGASESKAIEGAHAPREVGGASVRW